MSNDISSSESYVNRVAIGIALPSALLLIIAFWKQIYLQTDVMSLFSYLRADRPPLPFNQVTHSWGEHFFGDYAMNYWISRSSSFSIDVMYQTSWFPAAYIFLLPFTLFSYTTGFVMFVITGCGGVTASALHAMRGMSISQKLLFTFLVFLGAGPVVSAVDRGNAVILAVPLIYLYLISLSKKSRIAPYLLLGLIVAIKPHLALLIVLLPGGAGTIRRYVKAAAGIVFMQVFALLFVDKNPIRRVQQVLAGANHVAHEGVYANSRSLGSFITGIAGQIQHLYWIGSWTFDNRNFISLLTIGIVISVYLKRRNDVPAEIGALLICGLVVFALPFSPVYNSVILLPVLMIRFIKGEDELEKEENQNYWDKILVLVISCHILPIPFTYQNGISVSCLISPISFFILIFCVAANRNIRFSFKKFFCSCLITFVVLNISGWILERSQDQVFLKSVQSSLPQNFGQLGHVCQFLLDPQNEIIVGFDAKQKASGTYQNFFQTDELNYGIRIERDLTGAVSLIVGERSGKFSGVSVPIDLRTNHLIGQAKIKGNGVISMAVNGKSVSGLLGTLQPSCDKVMTGQGFSSERVWVGTTRLMVSGNRRSDLSRIISTSNFVLIIFGILLLLQISIGEQRRYEYEKHKNEKL
jgi:hypothetical protein